SSPNIAMYIGIGIALGAVVIGILGFAIFYVYKKRYLDSNFIPTP
ncbi:35568_t:CDS:1, partial [Racocetra persica]